MRFAVLGLVATVLALAGCRGEVRTDLNLSTLAAVEDGKAFAVPVRLGFDMGSAAFCQDHLPSLMVLLDSGYGDSHFLGCRHSGGRVLAEFTVPMPVTAGPHGKSPVYLRVQDRDGVTVAALARDEVVIADMRDLLHPDLRPAFQGPFEVAILARLYNDTAAPVTLSLPPAVVNGRTRAAASAITLARGSALSVAPTVPADKGLLQTILPLFWWPST